MKTLAGLTYKECPPVVTAEAMRFLDNDTKRSRVCTQSFWGTQSEPAALGSNEFASAIDAGYALMKLAGKALFNRVCEILGENASEKAVAMIPQKELLPLTGYIHGGCSPIGMKKPFPTVLDSSAEAFETICFSAGRIGAQVETSPKDLQKIVQLQLADVTVET